MDSRSTAARSATCPTTSGEFAVSILQPTTERPVQGGRWAGPGGTGGGSVHDEGRQHASSLRSRQPRVHEGPEGGARKVISIQQTDRQAWTGCRPRVEANTPLVIDVQLLYIPGQRGSEATTTSSLVSPRQDWTRKTRNKSENEDGGCAASLFATNCFVNKSCHRNGTYWS